MKALALSFLERVLPRGASALIVLLLAAALPPSVVGLYSAVIIAVTLVQSISDGAVRQIAVSAIDSVEGRDFLRRYSVLTAVIGGMTILVACLLVIWLNPGLAPQAWTLLPLALVPTFAAMRVESLAIMQSASRWRYLARAQLVASSGSLLVSIGLLWFTQSLVAATVQALLTEVVFTAQVRRSARVTAVPPRPHGDQDVRSYGREFGHLSLYASLAWLQSQADRVLLLMLGGTGRLGLFSLSWSLSRAGSDALSASTANVARPYLLRDGDTKRFTSTVERALLVQAVIWILTVAGASVLVAPILGPEWAPAIAAVPVLTLSGFSSVVEWSVTIAMVANSRIKWASPIKGVGVLMAVPIALVAVHDLWLASWLVVARECIVMVLMTFVTMGPARRACAVALGLTAVGAALALAIEVWT